MKRLLFFLILALSAHGQILSGILAGSSASAACTPSSTFAGSAGTALQTADTNFTVTLGSFKVNGTNSAYPTDAGISAAYYNACQPTNNQFAQIVLTKLGGSGVYATPAVRFTPGATPATTAAWYSCATQGGTVFLEYKSGGGGTSALLDSGGTANDNDTLKATAVGTTISCLLNGIVVAHATDTNLTSGYAGLYGFGVGNGSTSGVFSSFSAGTAP